MRLDSVLSSYFGTLNIRHHIPVTYQPIPNTADISFLVLTIRAQVQIADPSQK